MISVRERWLQRGARVLACCIVLLSTYGYADNPRTYGNFHTLGVIVDVPSGYNAYQIGEVRLYMTTGGDRRLQDPVQIGGNDYYACSVFDLQPNTTYGFRVEFYNTSSGLIDTDIFSGSTRAEPGAVSAPTAELHVSKQGSDSWVGSSAQPKRTIAGALSAVSLAGTHVIIHEGVYYETSLRPPAAGTTVAPLVIRAASGEEVVLDGSNPAWVQTGWNQLGNGYFSRSYTSTIQLAAYRDRITGKTLRCYPIPTLPGIMGQYATDFAHNFTDYNITGAYYGSGSWLTVYCPDFVPGGQVDIHAASSTTGFRHAGTNNIVYQDLTFRFYGSEAILLDSADDVRVNRCRFEVNNKHVTVRNGTDRTLIEDCTFIDDCNRWGMLAKTTAGGSYNDQIETGAIMVSSPYNGRGLVFRNNYIEGLFDGAHVVPGMHSPTVVTSETDFYGNTLRNITDDLIEIDGFARNVRVFDNNMRNYLSGISVAQAVHGPVYIVRNIMLGHGITTAATVEGLEGYPIKTNGGTDHGTTGWVFIYHNASWTDAPATSAFRVQYASWRSFIMKNNIWHGTERGWYTWSNPLSTIDMQNDIIYRESGSFLRDGNIEDLGSDYTRAAAAAVFPFLNGSIDADPQFRDPANGDLQPATGSTAIDGGIIIPGINDTRYTGSAPDIGPYEVGSCTVQFYETNSMASESAGYSVVTVLLDVYSPAQVTVSYSASGGSAANGTDYTLAAGTVTFTAGDTIRNIPVALHSDSNAEGPETIMLTLSSPSGAALGQASSHQITILDDDDTVPVVNFDQTASAAPEGAEGVPLNLVLNKPFGAAVSISLNVTGGGTTADPSEYSFSSPVVIPPGSLSGSLLVTLPKDHAVESPETLTIELGTLGNGTAGATNSHTLTITDNNHRTIYVDAQAPGANNGSSWPNAYTNLTDAIAAATAHDDVWVANGIYTPGTARADRFILGTNVSLYGGFAGGEALLEERDWARNLTVLSGDLARNDTVNWGNRSDNAYHVMELTNSILLDGFLIRGGYADGASLSYPWAVDAQGGGIWANQCENIILRNCFFADNTAIAGGGVFLRKCSGVTVEDCIFSGNRALEQDNNLGSGALGGLWGSTGEGALINRCVFSGNSAVSGDGGAVLTTGTPWEINFFNSLFVGNVAAAQGGALYMRAYGTRLVNCTLSGNHPTAVTSKDCIPLIRNTIIRNHATEFVTWNESVSLEYSNTETDTYAGTSGNISTNPLWVPPLTSTWKVNGAFNADTGISTLRDTSASWHANQHAGSTVNPDTTQYLQFSILSNSPTSLFVLGDAAALGANGRTYEIHSYKLQQSSPCINSGNAGTTLSPDIIGITRPQCGGPDMGAFEYDGRTDIDGDGLADEWELSYRSLLTDMSDSTDSDGDNFMDRAEYRAGTDPLNGSSHLSFSALSPALPDRVPVQFQSISGTVYKAQSTTNSAAASWTDCRHAKGPYDHLLSGAITGASPSSLIYLEYSPPRNLYRLTVE